MSRKGSLHFNTATSVVADTLNAKCPARSKPTNFNRSEFHQNSWSFLLIWWSRSKNDLTKQLRELKGELLALRVQKVAGGAPSKLTKMYVHIWIQNGHSNSSLAMSFASRSHEFWLWWTRRHGIICGSTTRTRNTSPLTYDRRRLAQSDGDLLKYAWIT